ncbi:MAG TPA: ABC transporter permease subunit [Phycisphaerales bacterium]|nr:ABC transporter permease subunit [Phycisphaerales bacterium]
MLLQSLTIARNAFVESVRQPVLLLLVLLSGLFQVFNTWNTGFSMSDTDSAGLTGDNKLLLDVGMGTIFVIGTILAGFIATAVMSREIENKTVLTVVSKPVSRHTLVIGKYLGVAAALAGSILVMLIFLMLAVRHGVMSTTADDLDAPVMLFGFGAVCLAAGLGAWCNFFYGWNFAQTTMSLLIPFVSVGYVLVLLFNKEWHLQPITKDLNAQIVMASIALGLAILVLSSVAVAASTRLGQVMTIVVCCGVFLMALMSNHLIGRHVFTNKPLGVVARVQPADESKVFNEPGQIATITLQQPMNEPPRVNEIFYYSPSPSGFPMVNKEMQPFDGDLREANDVMGPEAPQSIVVMESDRQTIKVRTTGDKPILLSRPPIYGDYVFNTPTSINKPALVAWAAIPNMQLFWLLDAVTQNRLIPGDYLVYVSLYAIFQIGAFLSLGVILFQRRDVG